LPFTKRLEISRIGGHAVIVNILVVGHIGDLGVAADTKRAARALIDVLHLDFLPGEAWLAETVGENFCGMLRFCWQTFTSRRSA